MRQRYLMSGRMGRSALLLAAMITFFGVGDAAYAQDSPKGAVRRQTKPRPTSGPVWKSTIQKSRLQAEGLSRKAIDVELRPLLEFVVERKKGTRAFAESVLDTDMKLKLVQHRGRDFFAILGGIAKLAVGMDAKYPDEGEKQLAAHVADRFRQHVFKPADLEAVVESVYAGYIARLKEIENTFLVELEIDVDDETIQKLRVTGGKVDADAIAGAIDRTLEGMGDDFGNTIVRELGSYLIGELVGGRLVSKTDSGLTKFGKNVAAGVVVDKALDEGMARAGYDPVRTIAGKVDAELDKMYGLLVEGDAEAYKNHEILKDQVAFYYDKDADVKSLCETAIATIERSGKLGMRWQMLQVHQQADERRDALTNAAWEAAWDDVNSIGVARGHYGRMERDELIRFARSCVSYYQGGQK